MQMPSAGKAAKPRGRCLCGHLKADHGKRLCWVCVDCKAYRPGSEASPSSVQKLVSPQSGPAREPQERRHLQGPGNPEAVQKQSATASALTKKTAIKNVTEAERQGREDFKAGKLCGKYKIFRSKYNLPESDDSLQWWNAYRRTGRLAQDEAQPPRPSRRQPLTPGVLNERNIALLREVNPPDPDSRL